VEKLALKTDRRTQLLDITAAALSACEFPAGLVVVLFGVLPGVGGCPIDRRVVLEQLGEFGDGRLRTPGRNVERGADDAGWQPSAARTLYMSSS
jgi:uncharacterized protein YjeT (DUF2065 family)